MNYKASMTEDTRATFTLRASRELLSRLREEADANSHSMNAEIIQRLEASLGLKSDRYTDTSGTEPIPLPQSYQEALRDMQKLQEVMTELSDRLALVKEKTILPPRP